MEKEKVLLEEYYKPSDEIMEHIFDIYAKYSKWKSSLNRQYKQFNSQTLYSYVDDSRKKFWGYIPLSYDTDTPQFFMPETRNQIIAILAKIASLIVKATFNGVEGLDMVKATTLRHIFDFWLRKPGRKLDNFWQFLYSIINGTVIVFTGYKSNVRTVKSIDTYDAKTGETSYTLKELDDSDTEEVIVNLEDFFFPKVWEPSIQKQNECIWRTIMLFSDFQEEFGGYELSKKVFPGSHFSDQSIFSELLSPDIKASEYVEVIKYFNKAKDQYSIIANGVLINPIKVRGLEEISPLPYNHKVLPFSKTIFEPLDTNFFYGTPLPQKVKSPQEAVNRLWELLLEREIRSVSSPIITNDPSVEFGIEFKPGRIYQVQGDPNSYKELSVAPTSSSYWNVVNTLNGMIQNTGSGGSGQVLQSLQPRSASEKSIEANNRKEVAGLYNLFYEDLLEQKAWLAIRTIVQFYTSSKVKRIIGTREFIKVLSLSESKLNIGGLGNRELRITETPAPKEDLAKESYMRSLLYKEKIEIIEATPEALRQIEFDVKISFDQENSPSTEKVLFLDYIRTLFGLFGNSNIISQKKAFFRMSEKFNENPSDLMEEGLEQEYNNDISEKPTPKEGQMPMMQNGLNSIRGEQNGAMGPGQAMVNNGTSKNNLMSGIK
jgi:hypothetical protein